MTISVMFHKCEVFHNHVLGVYITGMSEYVKMGQNKYPNIFLKKSSSNEYANIFERLKSSRMII